MYPLWGNIVGGMGCFFLPFKSVWIEKRKSYASSCAIVVYRHHLMPLSSIMVHLFQSYLQSRWRHDRHTQDAIAASISLVWCRWNEKKRQHLQLRSAEDWTTGPTFLCASSERKTDARHMQTQLQQLYTYIHLPKLKLLGPRIGCTFPAVILLQL